MSSGLLWVAKSMIAMPMTINKAAKKQPTSLAAWIGHFRNLFITFSPFPTSSRNGLFLTSKPRKYRCNCY